MTAKKPQYNNNDWPGLGIIKCEACGDPLRDHPIGPCDRIGQKVIHVAKPSTRGRYGGEAPESARKRHYRQNKEKK